MESPPLEGRVALQYEDYYPFMLHSLYIGNHLFGEAFGSYSWWAVPKGFIDRPEQLEIEETIWINPNYLNFKFYNGESHQCTSTLLIKSEGYSGIRNAILNAFWESRAEKSIALKVLDRDCGGRKLAIAKAG